MKNYSWFKFALCLAFWTPATSLRAERQTIPLLSDWKFIKQDVEVTAPATDWERVIVPHTWNDRDGGAASGRTPPNIQTPTEAAATADAAPKTRPYIKTDDPHMKDGYYRGIGCYARAIAIPAEWRDRKRVFVRFEAVSQVAKVYLNGELLGEHRGAFTAFCLELTAHLKYGATNELRVQADNSLQADVPPLSGDFNVCGGIYRPVALIVTDRLCITPLDYASPGVYLTTKSLTEERAEVEVRALVSNGTDGAVECPVEFQIKDARGKVVSTGKKSLTIADRATMPASATLGIKNPHRWNGRLDPYLYGVTVTIRSGAKTIDLVRQELGLRTVTITEKDGFLLNGKPYTIHGVNRHQDRQDQGWALSPADMDQDAQLILDMGATAVRNTHYPQSGYWHELADRSGLLMLNEVSLVDAITVSPEFDANAELQLRELIAQLYNHPSIAFWGLFNELSGKYNSKADPLLKRLKGVVQQLDASRLIVGASYGKDYHTFDRIADHTAFNRYPLWYAAVNKGAANAAQAFIDSDSGFLGKRTAFSEYGAGGNPAHHQEGALVKVTPNGQFHPEEWQTYVHEEVWRGLKDSPKVWGSFLWVMFDFPSGWRLEGGLVALNDKGLVTHDRKLRKDAYFFYKANWNLEPMLYITSRRMTPRRLASTDVQAFCNIGEVELKVNGVSQGMAKPDDVKVARWQGVVLKPGKNLVEVRAQSPAGVITDSCEWVLLDPAN